MKALLPLLLTLLATTAQAELVEIQWDAQQRMERRFDIAPGKFAELCGKLAKGQTVRWSFEGNAPTNFNVHFHVGKKVEFPTKLDGVSKSAGELKVEQDQDYCWMWSNKGAQPAGLSVQLQR
jgi:hypothetical protein